MAIGGWDRPEIGRRGLKLRATRGSASPGSRFTGFPVGSGVCLNASSAEVAQYERRSWATFSLFLLLSVLLFIGWARKQHFQIAERYRNVTWAVTVLVDK